ncbi:MAG TPA: GWxTD domain-containing protein, partial [Tepidisphaeraceae bacterium]
EMKEEHYRRIAYANVHFVAATLAGWKTDRGRVYISYGPPDELESHPDADPPNEQWLYHHIEGIGDNVIIEFTDPTRLGEYRMTADPNGVKVTMPLPGPGPNVFVENVDWSAVPAEVHRPRGAAPKATLITVPIDGGSAIVYIRIATSKGQTVAAAQDRVENRSLYHAAFDLPPGSYRVTVGTRHIGSTASPATRTTTFEVR